AAMHGFPTDWFSAISPPSPVPQDTQADSKPESSEEKQSPPHKQWLHSECANGSGIGSNDRTEQRHITEEEEMILSFGYTADRFYQKTVTRRNWKERHAQQFIKAWREGKPIDAYDKSPMYGGKKIATIKLTTEPYQEALRDINSWEVAYEGYPELSKDEFIDKFFPGFDTKQLLWVIRFEVVSFAKNVEKNNSEFFILNSTFSSALNISEIRRDGGTQSREKLDLSHVATLKEAIEDGAELDPVIVFYDGESYWLADGFHRCKASLESGLEDIQVIIHQGTRRDAVLYSVGANAEHKAVKPRSRADKRRAVMMLLNDPEWNKWSNCEIARRCKVSDPFVLSLRKKLTSNIRGENDSQSRTYRTKHGTVTTSTVMVGNNGNKRQGSVGKEGDREGLSSPSSESSHTPPEVEPPKSPPVSDYVVGFLTNLDRMSAEQRICCCDRLFDQMSDKELEEALYGIQQRLAANSRGNFQSRNQSC
ncbi:MAG: ParB N-terminal domain-containing protein, partial [Symploca sp. SIO2G7]|nr:ParB N-terminal domain-containing protein [Symploca sp. SIO2G7]